MRFSERSELESLNLIHFNEFGSFYEFWSMNAIQRMNGIQGLNRNYILNVVQGQDSWVDGYAKIKILTHISK